jgi:hypothetical protein
MTKKDGDKLRDIQSELRIMAGRYDPNSWTARDLERCDTAIQYALEAKRFIVKRLT